MGSKPVLSIVIPCKNEAQHLRKTLDALMREQQYGHIADITYVDNGSTDQSVAIAESYPITVRQTVGTISKVRNTGVRESTGEYFCFLDADIEVCDGWSREVVAIIRDQGPEAENLVFGDAYGLPADAGWIEKIWFKSLQKVISHINSGNMVMSRVLFEKLGGFDENLVTAEDYDICKRAVALGAKIVITPQLRTVHYGYPGTLKDFYRREKWHGLGMAKYLRSPYKSRPLLCAIITLTAPLVLTLVYLLLGTQALWVSIIVPLVLSLLYCMKRLDRYLSREPFQLWVLVVTYVLARTHSLVVILLRNNFNKESWKQKQKT